MRTIAFTTLFAVVVASTVACSGRSTDDGDDQQGALQNGGASDDARAQAMLPPGHHSFASDRHDLTFWIEDIVLLPDGVFSARFGSGLSNASGRLFNATGTYKVKAAGHDRAEVTLSYPQRDGAGPHIDTAIYEVSPDPAGNETVVLNFKNRSTETFPLLLRPNSKFAKIRFGESGEPSVVYGTVTDDAALEIRYAAKRAACGDGDNASVEAFAMVWTTNADQQTVRRGQSFGFDAKLPGDDYVAAIATPTSSPLQLWFHSTAPHCDQWDSKQGANYQFPRQ